MAVTFYHMAADPPYPFFLGHTVLTLLYPWIFGTYRVNGEVPIEWIKGSQKRTQNVCI